MKHITIEDNLHREFKIWCTIRGIPMKEGGEEAIRRMMDSERGQNERTRTQSPQDESGPPDAENHTREKI